MFKFSDQPSTLSSIYAQSFSLYKYVFAKTWYFALINMAIIGVLKFITTQYIPITNPDSFSHLTHPQILVFVCLNFVALLIAIYFIGFIMHKMVAVTGYIAETNSSLVIMRKWFTLTMSTFIVLLLITLGIYLFVLPAIFCAVLLSFYTPLILFDNKGAWGAVAGSCKLVWGNWWRTFAALIPAIFILLFYALLQQGLLKISSNVFFSFCAFAIFFTIFALLIYAFILVQYNDLKIRKKLKTV